jgi:hypothetical protein
MKKAAEVVFCFVFVAWSTGIFDGTCFCLVFVAGSAGIPPEYPAGTRFFLVFVAGSAGFPPDLVFD